MDEQFRRNLELERQTGYAFYEQEYRIQREEKLRKEAEDQAAQYLIEKEEERRQKEEERRQKEEAIQQKQQMLEKVYSLARIMKKSGISIDEIMKETGLSKEDADKL